MPKSNPKTTNEQLSECIHLTNSVAALCYEYLSTIVRIPIGFQTLVDDISGVLKVLGAVNLREIDVADFSRAIWECAKEMKWLRERLLEKRTKKWRSNQVTEYRRRVERLRVLWETIVMNMDQLATPEVIDAHISDRRFENRSLSYDHSHEVEMLARDRREKALNWLHPESYDKRHLEIRSRRNDSIGKWFFSTQEAQKWMKKGGVNILWGRSVAGTGKTFLSSLIIDNIKDYAPQGSVGVAYIYFSHKDQDQQKPTQVFASMIKQFSEQLMKLPVEVGDLYSRLKCENRRPTVTQLFTLLVTVAESFDHTYVVWDALDECDKILQRNQLIPLFQRMSQSDCFKLFLATRSEPSLIEENKDIFSAFGGARKLSIRARDEDIIKYIKEKINENLRFQRLIVRSSHRDYIANELKICSQRLFLPVDLHIRHLSRQPTLQKVFTELNKLKIYMDRKENVLHPTYSMVLNALSNQPKSRVGLAIETLSWLVKARRTLTIRELQQGISVKPGDHKLDESGIPDQETLDDVCSGLVVIDGDTIRLSHKTVQEYLLADEVIPSDADENITMSCLTFLSYNEFCRGACGREYSLEVRRQLYPFMDYAAKNMGFHLQLCKEDVTLDALSKLIMHPGSLSSYLQALKAQRSYSKDLGYHNRYIKQTPLHVATALGHSSLVRLLLERGDGDLDIKSAGTNIVDKSAIHCATNAGHSSIVRMLLETGINPSETIDGDKALLTAAAAGWGETVKLLLDEGADISDVGYDGDTALHRAASNGHTEVVILLLDRGVSMSVKARDGMTALHRAAFSGHEQIVRLLLDRGAIISSTGENRVTALHQAASGGHWRIVEMLLYEGANISSTKTYGETPLHCAAFEGHEKVVISLLGRGANVGAIAVKNGGETALHQAASQGFRMVVRALIDRGADIEVKTRYGVSVLQRAAHGGHTSIVRYLLDQGADVSAATIYGVTALHRAAAAGHEMTVQLLVERGAVLSTFDADGESALHAAAAAGHYYVVKFLIDSGVNVDEAAKISQETALHKAAFGGHRLVVEFLLHKGANRLASTKNGALPLHRAASCGHGPVARALLKQLANHQVSAAKNDGETALHCATLAGYDSMVTLLLEKGAEVSKKNGEGDTALHIAAYTGNISIAFNLLDHGANISERNHNSETAIDRARAVSQTAVADLLNGEIRKGPVKRWLPSSSRDHLRKRMW